jgi:probable phosphoglycerate mutase
VKLPFDRPTETEPFDPPAPAVTVDKPSSTKPPEAAAKGRKPDAPDPGGFPGGQPSDPPARRKLIAYIDGGARGNPGPAGFGVRIETHDGSLVAEISESIGIATNNVAEYRGLLAALAWARDHHAHDLLVRSDSLLLVQQMLGNYKVKNAGLQPLHAKARLMARDLDRVSFEHVRRESNTHADRLANAAMDSAAG